MFGGCSSGPVGGGEIFPVPGTGCDCPIDKYCVLKKDLKFQALGAVRHSEVWGCGGELEERKF